VSTWKTVSVLCGALALGTLAASAEAGERRPLLITERVDLFAEDGASWWVDELPRAGASPRAAAIRWLEQVRFVAAVPRASVVLGASLSSQSIVVRRPVSRDTPLYLQGGVTTALGLPRGALVGAEWWHGAMRIGVGVHAYSGATWRRPVYDGWRVLPAVGIGVGRSPVATGASAWRIPGQR
jgi:hypothetical protein